MIYGAGKMGKAYYNQIDQTGYCTIVAWVDQNYKDLQSMNVTSLDNIYDLEYDHIVIATENEKAVSEVKQLLQQKGIDSQKIL